MTMRREAIAALATMLVSCKHDASDSSARNRMANAGVANDVANDSGLIVHAPRGMARRIVSLSPSMTETLFAIGAGEAVVGRSRYCDFPAAASSLPQVGGYADPNLEAILALRPELVVGAHGPAGPEWAKRLTASGLEAYFPETESLQQIEAMITDLGQRTGHVTEAAALIAQMHDREDVVRHALVGKPKPRVLFVFGLEPIVVAGPHSFAEEVLAIAGGENAVKEGSAYPIMGIEHVLALQPDIILNAAVAEAHGLARIHKDSAGWKNLRAVQNGAVVSLNDERVLRPGPRIAEAIVVVARALHPEIVLP